MAFRFKQFSVEDQQSTMRVGSDAVLLGAWADTLNDTRILEIGTGCGVISLMLAQRSEALIDAIDNDHPSILQAQQNFAASHWDERLHPIQASLQNFVSPGIELYDHIVSNPPYFRNSLKSPDPVKNVAKHECMLTYEELILGVGKWLKKDGKLSVILPAQESQVFISMASELNLFLSRKLEIKPKTNKPVNRVLMEFSFNPPPGFTYGELSIRAEDGSYTPEYCAFTEPYYFSLK